MWHSHLNPMIDIIGCSGCFYIHLGLLFMKWFSWGGKRCWIVWARCIPLPTEGSKGFILQPLALLVMVESIFEALLVPGWIHCFSNNWCFFNYIQFIAEFQLGLFNWKGEDSLLQLQRVDDEGDEVDNGGICKKIGVFLSGIHDQWNVLDMSKLFEDRVWGGMLLYVSNHEDGLIFGISNGMKRPPWLWIRTLRCLCCLSDLTENFQKVICSRAVY
jgi:hypothetical protein